MPEMLMTYVAGHESFQFLVRNIEQVLILCMKTLIKQLNLFYHQECQQLKCGGKSFGKLQIKVIVKKKALGNDKEFKTIQ